MMHDDARAILSSLNQVEALRRARQDDPVLGERVDAVKRFQHQRFARSYADLQQAPDVSAAARFFLDELYGPHDFTARDAQFARIVPALVRLFPAEIVGTVRTLSELHALSEALDTDMAVKLRATPAIDRSSYGDAWRAVARHADRQLQIDWMLDVGRALVRYTRNPLLRHSLRLMRAPARAAGLGQLQQFLERGFDTFGALRAPEPFLALIASREREIAHWLFEGSDTTPRPPGFG